MRFPHRAQAFLRSGRAGKMEIYLGNLRAVDDTSVPLEGEI